MAYSLGSTRDGQNDTQSNKQTEAENKKEASVAASPEDGQRRPSDSSHILPEEDISNDKYDGSWYQSPLSKSLQQDESLFRFNPGQKCPAPRQKSKDGSWASEGMSSSSSRDIQHLGETLQSLSSQWQMLSDPATGEKPFRCVKSLSVSGESDFYYHPQMANFSRHYCQLQHLMEQRAQLLFLHEYAKRSHMATRFVRQLGVVLEKMNQLLANRAQEAQQPNTMWNLSLGALCQELQGHVTHWDLLWSKARSDHHLRRVLFSRAQMFSSMHQKLRLLELQALQLMERCIHTALSALTAAQVDRVPRDALVDLLCAVELYNQIVKDKNSQSRTSAWRSQTEFIPDVFLNGGGPKPFPVEQLMTIIAQSQAEKLAKQLYEWTSQQSHLLCETDLRMQRSKSEYPKLDGRLSSPAINIHIVQLEPQATGDALPKKLLHSPCFSNLPFSSFVCRDKECLDTLFKVLVSSTNLLAPCTSRKPLLDRGGGEERLLNRPKMSSRTNMMSLDLRTSDACMKLLCHYKNTVWMEFAKAAVRQFYYPPYSNTLGSVNQWSDEMMLLLVTWLRNSHTEDDIPEECKESLDRFCSYILSTAAFTQWDEMMCLSLGSGLKEKCVPVIKPDRSAVRTATMDLILQLFPPLHTVLQLLQHSQSRSKDIDLGVLCRSVATVQSSSFWVMSKSYQFLASWTLSKFLLVTQGDLKDLRGSVENLVQLTAAFSKDSTDHLIVRQTSLLTQALTELQAFSDLVLRIFSMDCKKMSMEIFEQTMPSAKHWRINYKTEIPIGPSDYAASAAQNVIGHVLEGVRSLPDDARVPALTEAMTAFIEAWMEHILKQKIKFSVQGALQLKQDFDVIRELICSEQYSLSEELHHKLLSLRVFHQVDNAIVCLLQQPVAKPYLPSRGWERFRRCCPNSSQVMDEAAGSLNNLESMDIQASRQQALTRAGSSVTPEPRSSTPPESYLAEAQQEWLDLRMHGSSRWKLPPVLRCFTKSES